MPSCVYTAPNWEIATCYGYKAFRHICDPSYGDGCRGWDIHGLVGEHATRDRVLEALNTFDPVLFFGVGHGNEETFTGHKLDKLFWVCNCGELRDRIIYLLSCLTGVSLGKDMVEKGAKAFIGYTREFAFLLESPPECRDPITEDRYAKYFFDPALVAIGALFRYRSAGEAFTEHIDRFNQWIDYWSRQSSEEAKYMVFYLKWDRDAAVLYGDSGARAGAPPAIPVPIFAIAGAIVGYLLTRDAGWSLVGTVIGLGIDRLRRKLGV